MKLKTKYNRFIKRNQRNIENAKLSLCWLVLFSLITSTYALLTFRSRVNNMTQQLDACQTQVETLYGNLEEILKQYPDQSIKLELRKEK